MWRLTGGMLLCTAKVVSKKTGERESGTKMLTVNMSGFQDESSLTFYE